eukprot:CAMPEP_0119007536 /NCGR_PEP_ID=MMETSP1176-20130426/3074_1 /TAXON_ID=265551 /ORGANISM="Synedropsis recta cf, Strain CCMP1620" /LENGTH=297 /DNA_ID=CAMNT_0006959705 /DNA_START=125 /DNA_END=1018 /DNA_ORIENTATION=+
MNNERYLRVSRDEQREQDEQESSNGVAAALEDDMKFAWAANPKSLPAKRASFQRLPTEDDDEDDDVEDYEDDMTSPTSNVPSASNSPTKMRSPATSQHGRAPSFDLDDDLDMDLQRYQLDFSDNSMDRKLRESTYLSENLERGHVSLALLYTAYTQTQVETRRQRVEQLLSVTTERDRLWIKICSWCDIYDRGLWALIVTTTLWVSITSLLLHHGILTLFGIVFFLARITAKPLYWYVWGRQVARKRKVTMEIYEQLNQRGMEMGTSGNNQHHQNEGDVSHHSNNGIITNDGSGDMV